MGQKGKKLQNFYVFHSYIISHALYNYIHTFCLFWYLKFIFQWHGEIQKAIKIVNIHIIYVFILVIHFTYIFTFFLGKNAPKNVKSHFGSQ